jgi:hypothetical protein
MRRMRQKITLLMILDIMALFENVDVYNVMTEILGLMPASNDGGYAAAKAVPRSQKWRRLQIARAMVCRIVRVKITAVMIQGE